MPTDPLSSFQAGAIVAGTETIMPLRATTIAVVIEGGRSLLAFDCAFSLACEVASDSPDRTTEPTEINAAPASPAELPALASPSRSPGQPTPTASPEVISPPCRSQCASG